MDMGSRIFPQLIRFQQDDNFGIPGSPSSVIKTNSCFSWQTGCSSCVIPTYMQLESFLNKASPFCEEKTSSKFSSQVNRPQKLKDLQLHSALHAIAQAAGNEQKCGHWFLVDYLCRINCIPWKAYDS